MWLEELRSAKFFTDADNVHATQNAPPQLMIDNSSTMSLPLLSKTKDGFMVSNL